ncbi:hypothetical protein [uncultured Desulfovibrio sp.]|uniref:hypothetical protein n=1 Tax=uncultured Desulfovibrio sp. TaxID=167968 RepID=UPI0026018BF3|nr:hypothetical protein [uncultured Desulfovibrio sp.]
MKRITSLLAVLCLTALLAACAGKGAGQLPPPESPAAAERSEQLWQALVRQSARHDAAPYRLGLSLRFGSQGDTRRVTALFWGNDDSHLRLDVMAGVGAVIANIVEADARFLIYSPRENVAYFHEGSTKPLLKVGVPVPLALADLSALLNGRFLRAFGEGHTPVAASSPDTAAFALEKRLGGVLTLDAQGLPVRWTENGDKGWRMELLYDEQGLPRRLNLTHANGQKAIVLVKQRDTVQQPFTEEQLGLALPEDTPLLPLSRYRAPADGKVAP